MKDKKDQKTKKKLIKAIEVYDLEPSIRKGFQKKAKKLLLRLDRSESCM